MLVFRGLRRRRWLLGAWHFGETKGWGHLARVGQTSMRLGDAYRTMPPHGMTWAQRRQTSERLPRRRGSRTFQTILERLAHVSEPLLSSRPPADRSSCTHNTRLLSTCFSSAFFCWPTQWKTTGWKTAGWIVVEIFFSQAGVWLRCFLNHPNNLKETQRAVCFPEHKLLTTLRYVS